MPSPIFIDTNIFIYAAGRPHPLKGPCLQILSLVARQPWLFVASAEVAQELMHYYLSGGRWTLGRQVVQGFITLMDQRIEPIYAADVQHAASLADRYSGLSARDMLHIAVMARLGTNTIISADRGFDSVASLVRHDPLNFQTWRPTIAADGTEGTD